MGCLFFFLKKKKKGYAEFPKHYFPEEKYAAENFSKAQLELYKYYLVSF